MLQNREDRKQCLVKDNTFADYSFPQPNPDQFLNLMLSKNIHRNKKASEN